MIETVVGPEASQSEMHQNKFWEVLGENIWITHCDDSVSKDESAV